MNSISKQNNQQINILYVTGGLASGGKERQIVEILKHIDKTKFNVGVISFGKNQQYSSIVSNLVDYYTEIEKASNKIKPLFSVWNCFKKFMPEIVHTWDPLSSFYVFMPIKWYGVKFIEGSIRDAGIAKGFHFYFKRFFIKRADLIVANSFIGLSNYKTKGDVIYNAIDAKRFLPAANSVNFNIVMTANFSVFKDHKTFISAAIKLLERKIINKTYLLGDGKSRLKWVQEIEQNHPEYKDNFVFTGSVSNVEEYLSLCKVGVLCSTVKYCEGVSNSVLEYMAAGLVPIATNIGGTCEIIHDSYNGFLIDPDDSEKIVELVEKIKNDQQLRYFLTRNALLTIKEKFDVGENLKKLERVYKEIIDE
jgi:glycosyltransferase involved in cell wall biosynthesis